ncbi:glycosyltransferase [Bradyrhizobium sp. 25ACV]
MSRAVPSVLHLAQSDTEGGANKAAFRLHQTLQELGLRSTYHVGRKHGHDPSVVPAHFPGFGLFASDVAAFLNASALRSYPHRMATPFSPMQLSYGRISRRLLAESDVVCLHWIAGAFLRPGQLTTIDRPIVWRLSDIWPFSGGCHYPGSCIGFEQSCGTCPQLGSTSVNDLSRLGIKQRERGYRNLDLTIAAPSRWIADLAGKSRLFAGRRIEHIPTGIDLRLFRPHEQATARRQLGLPTEGRLLMFGALGATEDPRKGFRFLKRAIEHLAAEAPRDVACVIFGNDSIGPGAPLAGLRVYQLGRINSEEKLALAYSAADVFIAPFLEDNLPNVVLEAIACGTPVAAFAVGGISEAVEHGRNGYLAPVEDVVELARGVSWLLDRAGQTGMRSTVRAVAEARFDIRVCGTRYRALFEELAFHRS